MAPYNPPIKHYAHLKVDLYSEDMLDMFMGPRGSRFYDLTQRLGVYYIWWNKKNQVIEVWGPYESFRDNHPVEVIHWELDHFVERHYFNKNVSEVIIGDENNV
jgi:hypothetical protein